MMKLLSLSGLLTAAWLAAPALADDAKTDVKAPAVKATDAAAPAADAKAKGEPAKAKTAAATDPKASSGTVVELKTSEGIIKVELADKEAPVSVKNFLGYIGDKFYDGTIFHRVIDGFMVQGGGYTADGDKLVEKPTKGPIALESKNGLKNDRGTLAMARTNNPDSATAQFFVNLVNNDRLNYPQPDGHGYAVFGKVVEGMDVVDKIAKAKTGIRMGMQDVPVTDVKLLSASVVKAASH